MAKSTSYKINPEKLKSTLLSIKARFESNSFRSMTEVSEMYSTGLKKALRMGHDSFITKFSDPNKFTVEDILKLADITNVDKEIIWKFIVTEIEKERVKHNINDLLSNSSEEDNENSSDNI